MGAIYQYKKEGPDPHILDPETIAALQQAVRTGDGEAYRRFADRDPLENYTKKGVKFWINF